MIASAATLGAMVSSCSGSDSEKTIGKPDFQPENREFSIAALEALGRVSSPVVSPDGSQILFGISYESVEQNRSNNDLYVMDCDGKNQKRITSTEKSESGAVWIDGGKRIAFLYPVDGKQQMWVMDADGSNRQAVTDVESGINGFLLSPDQQQVLLIGNVKYSRDAKDVYPDLPDATGRLIDDLMYKHWDEWVTEIPHPLVGKFDGKKVTDIIDIMQDEPYEAPMKPFGGVESFAWSPDGKSLVYVSRKLTGRAYAESTNSDLYLYNTDDKTTVNLTEGMMGYDTNPAFSPDGKYIAWLSMEHDGYESDKNRIFIHETATGIKTDLTVDWDYTADMIAWRPDSKALYFIAPKDGVTPLFSIDIESKKVDVVAEGIYDYAAIQPVGNDRIISMRHSMLQPNELISITVGQTPEQITDVNTELLTACDMPTVQKHIVPTTDGKEMVAWVVLPPNLDASNKYPAILYCQGGPQQAVSQFWSYRWNFALMASQGYVIIAPNRRGVPGFGTEWNAQISKDYGGQNMKDYFSATDYIKSQPYVDGEHVGAVGASYGGFSVYWLAGHHEGRFAAFIAHAGIFDMETQYLETEEMWFANWDMGGAYWKTDDPVVQRTFANSPHRFVDKWDTPILVTHGEYDFRILASQGMMAFNAARLRNVPAELLVFPDENHWILKPQNAVMWQRVFFRWLDRWLKDQPKTDE